MKCPKCQIDNKEGIKFCRKCGTDMTPAPLWKPSWKWHAQTLLVIYASLIVLFFALNHVLKPYLRQIPKDITPWLKEMPKQ
ncbi:MAG: hypothetical protein A2219_01895 [Elusimicrobia bacterium RIFOXYA2_FULL_50_26]|nr:MAG: hypothetical protein A2219_01895 [Elusimicrobia bacterium RIFOXYA2_FULL_50_26]OGS24012.1 MAG: hypothetical protein A2314_02515 [Elusimicrobia bacterium RIFOXYB2_FULL_50_12]